MPGQAVEIGRSCRWVIDPFAQQFAAVDQVDGQSVVQLKRFREKGFYSGGRFQLHLLPGRHTLTLGFHDDRGSGSVSWSTSNVVKTIEIKAGQVIHLALSTSGRTWTANVLDGSSARDAIVEDFNALSRERVLE